MPTCASPSSLHRYLDRLQTARANLPQYFRINWVDKTMREDEEQMAVYGYSFSMLKLK